VGVVVCFDVCVGVLFVYVVCLCGYMWVVSGWVWVCVCIYIFVCMCACGCVCVCVCGVVCVRCVCVCVCVSGVYVCVYASVRECAN
jgi:hypothetical protein